jgi:hypothetical protein
MPSFFHPPSNDKANRAKPPRKTLSMPYYYFHDYLLCISIMQRRCQSKKPWNGASKKKGNAIDFIAFPFFFLSMPGSRACIYYEKDFIVDARNFIIKVLIIPSITQNKKAIIPI